LIPGSVYGVILESREENMMATNFIFVMLAFFPTISQPECLGRSVCQDMWNKAQKLDRTELTIQNNPAAVFVVVQPTGNAKIGSDEFVTFKDLLESYFPASTASKQTKRDQFLSAIAQPGGPIEVAFKYLKRRGLLDTIPDVQNFGHLHVQNSVTTTLENMWFQSTGFEHTFVGEKVANNGYRGFHNWYQFYLEQTHNNNITDVQPFRYKDRAEPRLIYQLKFKWDGANKQVAGSPGEQGSSSIFVGTSPSFDIALFTVCFIEHKGKECQCTIGRTSITVQTHPKDNAPDQVASAYPTVVEFEEVYQDRRCTYPDPFYRTKCGQTGIQENGCLQKGCCYVTHECFYPRDHKCDIVEPENRKQCGNANVDRTQCEQMGCCFVDIGNPACFEGHP